MTGKVSAKKPLDTSVSHSVEKISANAMLVRASVWFLPAAILVIAIAVFYLKVEQQKAIHSLRTEDLSAVKIGREAIRHVLRQAKFDLDFIARDFDRKHLGAHSPDRGMEDFSQELINFSQSHPVYNQIRWIDETGMEQLRINLNDGLAVRVPEDQLQNKRHRYYFAEAVNLPLGSVYVSPLDLNMEHGEVEIPYKPMIRLVTPVDDAHGRRRGVIVLNYLGRHLLDTFVREVSSVDERIMLLNQDGYYLRSPRKGEEWGFMWQRKEHTLGNTFPEAWRRIRTEDRGQFLDQDGLWTFATGYPIRDIQSSLSEAALARNYQWKIVGFVSYANLVADTAIVRRAVWATVALALSVLLLLSWRSARGHLVRRELEQELEIKAHQDSLTGLHNRGYFHELTEQEMERVKRFESPVSLMLFDVDHFKAVNDTYGHDVGDAVLKRLAEASALSLRKIDILARWGGEEFVVLLPGIGGDQAVEAAERLRIVLSKVRVPLSSGQSIGFTVSVGVTELNDPLEGVEAMIKRADNALYAAKQEGRNCVRREQARETREA